MYKPIIATKLMPILLVGDLQLVVFDGLYFVLYCSYLTYGCSC